MLACKVSTDNFSVLLKETGQVLISLITLQVVSLLARATALIATVLLLTLPLRIILPFLTEGAISVAEIRGSARNSI